jgi:serine/threonine protein kinase
MIAFLCPNCGAQLRVRAELGGTKRKCPSCKQKIEAPRDSAEGQAVTFVPSGTPWSDQTALQPTPRDDAPSLGADSSAEGGTEWETEEGYSPEDLAFLATPLSPDEMGRLGNYRILKVLGSGGMGIVFLAEDNLLKRQVALKVMKASLAKVDKDRKRFLREAQAAASIDHEHIVTIYQVGEDRGVPFLAMKLLQGESLEDRLNKFGERLPVPEIIRIGQEVSEGLGAAHSVRLIHRDIKPANIWLESGRDKVRIVDFGLARGSREDTDVTQKGMIVGTPAYMSPEQANDNPLDHRSDLFSLGCVLYRMCTGRLPFEGKTTLAMLMALASKTPKPPLAYNSSLPPALSDLVMRLLRKEPGGRPASAQVVWDSLEQIRKDLAAPRAPAGQQNEPDIILPEPPRTKTVTPPSQRRPEPVQEVKEAEEVEVTKSRSRERRRPSGSRKKKSQRSRPEYDQAERRVIGFAIFVGVIVAGLILFLIIRHIYRSRYAPPVEEPDQPAQVQRPPQEPAPPRNGPLGPEP